MRCRDYPALHGVDGTDVAYSSQDNRGHPQWRQAISKKATKFLMLSGLPESGHPWDNCA